MNRPALQACLRGSGSSNQEFPRHPSLAIARWYTSRNDLALPSRVNLSNTSRLPSIPLEDRFSLDEISCKIALAIDSTFPTSNSDPTLLSTISGRGPWSTVTTGVPDAIDSRGIRPCPSYTDGKTVRSQHRYSSARSENGRLGSMKTRSPSPNRYANLWSFLFSLPLPTMTRWAFFPDEFTLCRLRISCP